MPKRSDYPSQKYRPEYYKEHIVQYNQSCKKYYLKKIGCHMIEKPYFSIQHFPEGVNPFQKDLENLKNYHH